MSPFQWLAIDPLSGEPPLHGDITSCNLANQDKEMQALSVWDREDPFTRVATTQLYVYGKTCPH